MIKGVNKKIIEVRDPGSIYFEKAVFYLRPHIRQLPEEMSLDEIRLYMAENGLNNLVPRKKRRRHLLIAGALVLTAAAVLFVVL